MCAGTLSPRAGRSKASLAASGVQVPSVFGGTSTANQPQRAIVPREDPNVSFDPRMQNMAIEPDHDVDDLVNIMSREGVRISSEMLESNKIYSFEHE